MEYIRREGRIQAIQFFNTEGIGTHITRFDPKINYKYYEGNYYLIVRSDGVGNVSTLIQQGDYIVKNEERPILMREVEFNKKYVKK